MITIKLYLEIRVRLNRYCPLEKVFVESEAKTSRASGNVRNAHVVRLNGPIRMAAIEQNMSVPMS